MNADMALDSVFTVDCHYQAPGKAASFLLIEGSRAAFVDNNTARAVPRLLDALTQHGLTPGHVDYLIITHVHLDHAGGTAPLLRACPNATVLAHPKAARHLAEPTRLAAGAMAVYGRERFEQLYGTIEPVPAERIRTVGDGECLIWGARNLRFLHTLGHASHHCCIHDSRTNGVFTGDACGLGLPEPCTRQSQFALCTTAPPDFDPVEARKTIGRILDTGAEYLFLPHFGIHAQPRRTAAMVSAALDRMEAIVEEARAAGVADGALQEYCETRVIEATHAHLRDCAVQDLETVWDWLGDDPHINAMGLAHLIRQRRR